jgi:invasion protein IalB
MRRGLKLALLFVGGSVLMMVSTAAAFLIGHGVGANEKLVASKALRAREQATLASMNMTKTVFDGWSLLCRDWPGNERRCVLFIAVADPSMKQVLLTFSVARTPKGMPVLIVDTPPGVVLDEGVTVTPGTAESVKLAIRSCGPRRCRAIAELGPSLQAALSSADTTSVSYVRSNNQQSSYDLPTRGFRDAITAWFAGSELQPPVSAAVR